MNVKLLSKLLSLCLVVVALFSMIMPVTAETKQPSLGEKQQMFIFSWLAEGISDVAGTSSFLEEKLTGYINGALNDTTVQSYIGHWKLVWGPIINTKEAVFKEYAINALYVVQNTQNNQYVVATSGTNPSSLYDWVIEDSDVIFSVEWPYGNLPTDEKPRISAGTHIGIKILLEMQSSGQTVLEFLNNVKAKEVIFTGHSLGGALSPTLALAIMEQSSPAMHISVYPFAGPTPGNSQFSHYYESKLGASTTRVWNKLDTVPHAWNETMLADVPNLYKPQVKPGLLVKLAVSSAELLASEQDYVQLLPNTKGLPGSVAHPITNVCSSPALFMPDSTFHKNLVMRLKKKVSESSELKQKIAKEFDIQLPDLFDWKAFLKDSKQEFEAFFNQIAYQHTQAYFKLLNMVDAACYVQERYMAKKPTVE